MHLQTIAHNRNQFRMNLVLVLLIIPLQLVEFDEHDGLLRVEMTTESLSNVGNEGNHDRQSLRSEGCERFVSRWTEERSAGLTEMLGGDVLEPS